MIAACFSSTARNAAQAPGLEVEGGGAPLLVPGQRNLNEADSERHKRSCMAAVHQREGKQDAKAAKIMVRSVFSPVGNLQSVCILLS